jgi:hypothetical protein
MISSLLESEIIVGLNGKRGLTKPPKYDIIYTTKGKEIKK